MGKLRGIIELKNQELSSLTLLQRQQLEGSEREAAELRQSVKQLELRGVEDRRALEVEMF
jgi:hypothetical protein